MTNVGCIDMQYTVTCKTLSDQKRFEAIMQDKELDALIDENDSLEVMYQKISQKFQISQDKFMAAVEDIKMKTQQVFDRWQQKKAELTEDELDCVVGGSIFSSIGAWWDRNKKTIGKIALAAVVTVGCVAACAVTAGAAGAAVGALGAYIAGSAVTTAAITGGVAGAVAGTAIGIKSAITG